VTVIEPSPEANWNANVTWTMSPKTMLNVRNGGYWGYFPLEPTPPNTRSGPFPHFDAVTGIYSVNTNYYYRADRVRDVSAATLTHYADNFAGKSHEFKFGFEYEHSKIRNESGYPGGRYYYDYGGDPYLVFLWDGYVTDATVNRTSMYAQDTWTVTDRLTVNPGIRLDINRGSVPTGNVLSNTALAPRVGAAFDITGDHRTVLRAHYGRYHEAFGTTEYQFTDTATQTVQITARVNGPGNYTELTRLEAAAPAHPIVRITGPLIKSEYQLSQSFERARGAGGS